MSEIDPRVISAVDHLQKAAIEMIAAMRNALDVAEDLVGDPAALTQLIQDAASAAKSVIPSTAAAAPSAPAAYAAERVERIPVD